MAEISDTPPPATVPPLAIAPVPAPVTNTSPPIGGSDPTPQINGVPDAAPVIPAEAPPSNDGNSTVPDTTANTSPCAEMSFRCSREEGKEQREVVYCSFLTIPCTINPLPQPQLFNGDFDNNLSGFFDEQEPTHPNPHLEADLARAMALSLGQQPDTSTPGTSTSAILMLCLDLP
ncbi:hypothetical protein B0H10DRAFT_2225581 [Mycena sp. CBHHK59/15]|nr:hypothetical protein B0H10DRAFT_2225581 [Mycena sp. CBHHK59/15]